MSLLCAPHTRHLIYNKFNISFPRIKQKNPKTLTEIYYHPIFAVKKRELLFIDFQDLQLPKYTSKLMSSIAETILENAKPHKISGIRFNTRATLTLYLLIQLIFAILQFTYSNIK